MNFYERRILRIFPALISVYLFCFIVGLIVAIPSDFEKYGESLTNSAFFISNYFFYNEAGYFDTAAHTKPLLHTWSLSVEEQFYLIWPVALILLWRCKQKWTRISILVIASGISLAYAEWEIAVENQPAAFYLLPARGWELLIGALLAIKLPDYRFGATCGNLLSALGLSMMIASIIGLSADNAFPGVSALPACIGAALAIAGGHGHRPFAARLYANPPVVFLGLISYSLYLWHWPIFAYWTLTLDRAPLFFEALMLMAASMPLAFLSYRFIERPFRKRRKRFSGRRTIQFGTAAMASCALIGLAISATNGFPTRIGAEAGEIYVLSENKKLARGCSQAVAAK